VCFEVLTTDKSCGDFSVITTAKTRKIKPVQIDNVPAEKRYAKLKCRKYDPKYVCKATDGRSRSAEVPYN
jgi:hypothetical protein